MNNMIWSLALSCLLAPPVEKSDEATTHLYVRTSPAGAEIVLDGKSIGKSPGVFPVESGARRLVIELDGHVAEDQKITIRNGRVTRIELTLKPRPEGAMDQPVTFEHIKVGKKVSDFPEPVDLSTPLSAWAAYTRASGSQDAQGVVDLSWVKIDAQELELFWTKTDPVVAVAQPGEPADPDHGPKIVHKVQNVNERMEMTVATSGLSTLSLLVKDSGWESRFLVFISPKEGWV